jgi:acetyl esterase/lipase
MYINYYLIVITVLLCGAIGATGHNSSIQSERLPAAARHHYAAYGNGYTEFKDVQYGDAEGSYNLLDAYLPDNRNDSTKVIVYIHGGSWVKGDKKELPRQFIDELAGRQGYAVATINYRLVKEGRNIFPAQIEDIRKALAFISANAREYRYSPDRFALMGASAGAHLALLYAYAYDSLRQVKTVVDIFGPTDLSDPSVRAEGLESNDIIVNYLGTKDTAANIVKQASPYFQLTAAGGVPTILFHGTADALVNVRQSEKLYEKLKSLRVPAQLELYPGGKHDLPPLIAIDVFGKIIAWLKQYYPA